MNLADLSTPEFHQNPYPTYERIRAAGELVAATPDILITGHYHIIDALLHDRRMGKGYMESVRARYGEMGTTQPAFLALSRMFLMMNPPEHTRLRALLMKAFNAKSIETMKEVSQRVADKLVDDFPPDRPFDLLQAFALPLPIQIICSLLDVPIEDAMTLGSAVRQLALALEAAPLDEAGIQRANCAALELEAYFRPLVERRRTQMGADLISQLLATQVGTEQLTDDEVISNVILLFAAGHETTSSMIGNALVALHQHPDQLQLLLRSPRLLPMAVAECMRYESSVQFLTRMALERTEIGGIALQEGTLVFMCLGSANRDPRQFPEPDRFLVERPLDANRLIMFGGGIHYCLGSRLALVQLQIAIGTILARRPELRLLNLDGLMWHSRNTLRGIKSLIGILR